MIYYPGKEATSIFRLMNKVYMVSFQEILFYERANVRMTIRKMYWER